MEDLSTETLTIDKLVYGGDGLGRMPGGEVIFIPWSAPGDEVKVSPLPGGRKPLKGAIREILQPGLDRKAAPCSVFGACGGCQWQHIAPAAQRDWKRRIVEESLQRLGKLNDVNVLETIGSDETAWHYRNRVQWEIDTRGRLGYFKAQSHEVIAFDHCWIVPEALNKLAVWLQTYFTRHGSQGIKRIEAAVNPEGQILLGLEGEAGPGFKTLAQELGDAFPQEADPMQVRVAGVVHLDEGEIISGDDFLVHTLAGNHYQVSAESFFQTNPAAAEAMLGCLDRWLPEGLASLIDIYAGVGTFSIHVRHKAARILAIESAPSACHDARVNFGKNQALHIGLLEGDARKILAKLDEDFEGAIIDPPRSGCQPEVLDWLTRHVTKHLIYVSCNPTTLARDLRKLADAGWHIEAVQPLDMFPQTYHIESVARLSRK